MAKPKRRKRIYIAGAITGADLIKQCRLASFISAWVVNRGWAYYNPFGSCFHEACHIVESEDWYRQDLEWMADCEAIVLMPGWETSKGANIELKFAFDNEFEIYEWKNGLVEYKGGLHIAAGLPEGQA